jgi:hypothetical protein
MRSAATLTLLAAFSAAGVAAADPAISGGTCLPPRPGDAWTEVWIEVSNPGPGEVRGTVEAELIPYRRRGPRASAQATIPAGSRKRWFMLMYLGSTAHGSIAFRVRDEFGKVVAEREERPVWAETGRKSLTVVQSSAAMPALVGALSDAKLSGLLLTRWELDPEFMPEHREAWSSAGVVALADADLALANDAQRKALRDWVEDGGRLLILPGSDPAWLERPEIQAFAPTGSARRADGGDETLAARIGAGVPAYRLEHEGPVASTALPYGAHLWRAGRGAVCVCAFDTRHPSIGRGRAGEVYAEDLFRALGQAADPWKPYASRSWYEWRDFSNALGEGLIEYPSTALLLLALTAFIVAAGPVNFVLMRRWHRTAWTVLTVPALGGVTTALLLLGGWIARDRSVSANRTTVLVPVAGSKDAAAYENIVLVTGGRREGRLRSETGVLGSLSSGRHQATADITHLAPDADLLWQFEPKEPALFYAVGRGTFGAVSGEIVLGGGVYGTLELVNESEFDLESPLLFVGGHPLTVDDIPAGRTLRTSDFRQIPWHRLNRRYDENERADRRLRFLASLDGTLAAGGGGRYWLAAYVKSKRPPPTLDGRPVTLRADETVVLIPLKGGRR